MSKKTRAERNLKFETLQLHVGTGKSGSGNRSKEQCRSIRPLLSYSTTPIMRSKIRTQDAGNICGRLTNPTEDVFEQRMAALEGGVAALAVASGAAGKPSTTPSSTWRKKGDHIVSAKNIYGGFYNLLAHTLPAYGISTTFVRCIRSG